MSQIGCHITLKRLKLYQFEDVNRRIKELVAFFFSIAYLFAWVCLGNNFEDYFNKTYAKFKYFAEIITS